MIGDSGERRETSVIETAGGAGGYKLIGIALGLAVRSQPLGMAMGAFGATRSIYVNFVARGHEVVFPKNTAMQIGIGTRAASAPDERPRTATGFGHKTIATCRCHLRIDFD